MRNFFKHNFLSILVCLCVTAALASATTINRPYGSSDYAGGAKAVGAKVNAEFDNIVDWLNGGNISSGNIAALGVQGVNLFANFKITSSSSYFTMTSPTAATITNLSTTITTSGRPVHVSLQGAGESYMINGTSTLRSFLMSGDGMWNAANMLFMRDSSTVSQQTINYNNGLLYKDTCSSYAHMDHPSAGTYTYTAKVFSGAGSQVTVGGCKLVVREL